MFENISSVEKVLRSELNFCAVLQSAARSGGGGAEESSQTRVWRWNEKLLL